MLRDAIAALRQFAAFAFFFKVFGFFDDDTRQGQQCNRLGIAIKPLKVSAAAHTKSKLATVPIITVAT